LAGFLKGDTAQMAQLVSAAIGKPGTEDLLLATEADTEGWYGKMKNAHELTGRAMDSAQRNDAKESAAMFQAAAGLRDVDRETGSRRVSRQTRRSGWPRTAMCGPGGAGLGAGRRYGRRREAGRRTRQDVPPGHACPEILAAHDPCGGRLGAQKPEAGRRILQVASAIELGGHFSLLPAYVRGEAYLMLHDGNRAAVEFHKFMTTEDGREFPMGRAGPPRIGTCLRHAGRYDQSTRGVSRLPRPMEKRRP